jgi:hypothetical protein
MIIDSHAHLHPSQADLEDWDFDGTADALRQQQRILAIYHRPAGVTDSGETVKDAWKLFWDQDQPNSWAGFKDVRFRIEEEKFVWEKDGVTYRAPVRPAADAAKLIGLMDATGVDKAVLQASLPYSRFYGRMMRAYPGRFLPFGILQDDGEIDDAVTALHAMVEDGLTGVYQNPKPGWPGYDDYHTPRFDPVWKEVERLKLPVYAMGFAPTDGNYTADLENCKVWMDRYPTITRVLVHGFPPKALLDETGKFRVTDLMKRVTNDFPTYLELLPWAMGSYTHDRTDEMVKVVYDTFGPTKFCWGTEFIKAAAPHTPEHYAEMQGYFETHCPYMSAQDRALILGDNLARAFGVASDAGTGSPKRAAVAVH